MDEYFPGKTIIEQVIQWNAAYQRIVLENFSNAAANHTHTSGKSKTEIKRKTIKTHTG